MPRSTYAKAGVDVQRLRTIQQSLGGTFAKSFAFRTGKIGSPRMKIGHYGGMIDLGKGLSLTLHTDGVGSKVLVAQEMMKFDTIGIDCIAMSVNDLISLGSEPISILDYIALQRQDEELVNEIAKGLLEGARLSSIAIVGGETAVLGDIIKGRNGKGFDLVSMGVGLVKNSDVVDGSSIVPGDVVVGVASSGLHSNGYTLARKVLRKHSLEDQPRGLEETLGEELLRPTSIYVKPTLKVLRSCDVHGIGHITGGSFSKLSRLLGKGLGLEMELPVPPLIFSLIKEAGNISDYEMYRTFNMGVGLCVMTAEREAKKVIRNFEESGHPAWQLGEVKRRRGILVNGVSISG